MGVGLSQMLFLHQLIESNDFFFVMLLIWWTTLIFDVEPTLSWIYSPVMMYNCFYALLDSACHFVEDFFHLSSWEILICSFPLLYCLCPVLLSGNTGIITWVRNFSTSVFGRHCKMVLSVFMNSPNFRSSNIRWCDNFDQQIWFIKLTRKE